MSRSCTSWLIGQGPAPRNFQQTLAGTIDNTADPKSAAPFERVTTTLPAAATSAPASPTRMWLASTRRAECSVPLNFTWVAVVNPQPRIRTSDAVDPTLTHSGYRLDSTGLAPGTQFVAGLRGPARRDRRAGRQPCPRLPGRARLARPVRRGPAAGGADLPHRRPRPVRPGRAGPARRARGPAGLGRRGPRGGD